MKYTNAQAVGEAIFKELLPEVTLMLKRKDEPLRLGSVAGGRFGMKSRWYAKKPKEKK